MISLSCEENYYRRAPPNYRGQARESGRAGRDGGDYSPAAGIHGREQFGAEDRYRPRADCGDRDFAPAGRLGAEGRGGRERSRQFDTDYHQWRDEQLSALDDDYRAWRGERYKKFAEEFSQWRSGSTRPEDDGRSKSGDKENPGRSK